MDDSPRCARTWVLPPPIDDLDAVARRWNIPPLVAQILINRGLRDDNEAAAFLSPQMNDLFAPEALPGIAEASRLVAQAIRAQKKICIYGDYDVDGTAGVAILWHLIHLAGGQVQWYVPHRIEEGYGLNVDAVRRLVQQGAELMITVDCGVTAVECARVVREAGCQLVITDHHDLQVELPEADAIVHPRVGGTYANADICGAGVAFKLAWAVAAQLSGDTKVAGPFRELLLELLALAALGTLADVVAVRGENRIIARHGLERLARTRIVGLQALVAQAGGSRQVSCTDVAFRLAPRLNAAGRMGHARLAVELMTTANPARAREIALYLDDQNRSRQATERRVLQEALRVIERDGLAGDARRAIVVAGDDWHAGVLGIVASRIVEQYHRPTIVISMKNGEGHGSGRSVRHFHLADALAACREHLQSFGGHAMAAGIRVSTTRLGPFTDAFLSLANQQLTGADLVPTLRLDGQTDLGALTLATAQAIAGLGPFGIGNPKPKLATGWLGLAQEPRAVGAGGEHLQAVFRENGHWIRGIGFGLSRRLEDLKEARCCRVAFEPQINEFQGRPSVELRILDMQFPDAIDKPGP